MADRSSSVMTGSSCIQTIFLVKALARLYDEMIARISGVGGSFGMEDSESPNR